MPEAFDFPLGCELWAPLRLTGTEKISRVSHSLAVIGRLKKDVSVAQARAEMGLIARRLEQQYPTTNEASAVLVTPLTDLTSKETGRFTLVLMGATLFVLLLACTNVSNLYLARINSKRKEFALRISLGASRARVARQVVTEGIVGGTIAGSLGLLLAYWNLGVTKASFPSQIMPVSYTHLHRQCHPYRRLPRQRRVRPCQSRLDGLYGDSGYPVSPGLYVRPAADTPLHQRASRRA